MGDADDVFSTGFGSGGRGARERILAAARTLFYRDGIHVTGVDQLAHFAHVSKRTFYRHFSAKDTLVAEYLKELHTSGAIPREQALAVAGRTPRERLLAIFDSAPEPRIRGCPFHNAAVEAADSMQPVHDIVNLHKRSFIAQLIDTCAQTSTADPELLGHQLAVLFEGAVALSTSLNDSAPMHHARSAAEVLIDAASDDRGVASGPAAISFTGAGR